MPIARLGGGAADDEAGHGLRLLRSHAGGAGALLPAREARAMLAVRANRLLAGGSGIQPAFVIALTEALRLGLQFSTCLLRGVVGGCHSGHTVGSR
ncbi:aromatic amino acid lyase [Streptomyces caeni]|uniref:Aromatic amino acid lyase n=1 Tax=Streptomyces caeni TaxID=2307231 RepID=A0ABW4IQF3_9ACTN